MNQPWIYICSPSWSPLPPPSPSHPSGSSQCTSPEHLSHASNLGWRSVSHLVIYMFQCYFWTLELVLYIKNKILVWNLGNLFVEGPCFSISEIHLSVLHVSWFLYDRFNLFDFSSALTVMIWSFSSVNTSIFSQVSSALMLLLIISIKLCDHIWLSDMPHKIPLFHSLCIFHFLQILKLLFSYPFMSDSLPPHGLQHSKPPSPSPTPKVFPSPCPLHQWCHPAISSSDALISFFPQSFPASGTFPMSLLFASDDQNTGVSVSASVLPTEHSGLISLKIDWFDLLAVQGTLRSLIQHHSSKVSVLQRSAFFMIQLSQSYMTTEITIALIIQIFIGRVMSLLFNTLSRFIISKKQMSSDFMDAVTTLVILEPKKRKSITTSTFSPSICHEVVGPDAMILVVFF